MVLRMYERQHADRGYQVELIEASPGEEAGLKSATATVKGENAHGVLKAERGVHRLFGCLLDAVHRRYTAFAQVVVALLLPEDEAVEIDESDLRVDTYRASGAGGQSTSTRPILGRSDHPPADGDRRSVPERALADVQQADGAAHLALSARRAAGRGARRRRVARERGAAQDIGFGSQIRSYVLQSLLGPSRPSH